MILIKSSASLLHQPAEPSTDADTLPNPFKMVEMIGRTCYKSEEKTTDTSWCKFCMNLINRQHFAMLEHGIVYTRLNLPKVWVEEHSDQLFLPYTVYECCEPDVERGEDDWVQVYFICSLSHLFNPRWFSDNSANPLGEPCKVFEYIRHELLIELQHRATDEWNEWADQFCLQPYELNDGVWTNSLVEFLPGPAFIKNQYKSVKFICDRGVSHELARHRCAVAQESTRYCNYSKAKFGGQIQCVEPADYDTWPEQRRTLFEDHLVKTEKLYMWYLEDGLTPQQARAVLPNALKTEVILTMPMWQWEHFLNLRSKGTTGAPHPDMKRVADMIAEDLMK